jgi:hypothetical protein
VIALAIEESTESRQHTVCVGVGGGGVLRTQCFAADNAGVGLNARPPRGRMQYVANVVSSGPGGGGPFRGLTHTCVGGGELEGGGLGL